MESFIIYLLKASALLGIFYLSYFFLLKKETSFNLNRKYLLLGIITAGILPAIYFTKKVYVEASPQSYSFTVNSSEISSVPVETPIDWWQIAGIVYLILTGFFLLRFSLQLISVFRILYSYKTQNNSGLKYLKTENDHLPFSFFNYIVYNPKIHSEKDLELILEHEKIHARQLHSADILLVNLVSCILWFNPFAWLYKKSVEQNLEFIADRETVTTNAEIKEYQRALVKVSIADLRPALTNHFYQSFIKKRILMLNKKSSPQSPAWKLSLLMPVLLAFMLLFNVKTEAQEIPQKQSDEKTKASEVSETIETKVEENTGTNEIQDANQIVKVKKNEAPAVRSSSSKIIKIQQTDFSNLGNDPLYLINGKSFKASELKNKYIGLNSEIEILIGASAVKRYGKEAENGVIIIPNAKLIRNFNQEMKNLKSQNKFSGKYIMIGENGRPNFINVNSGRNLAVVQNAISINSKHSLKEGSESNPSNVQDIRKKETGSISNKKKDHFEYRNGNSKSIEFTSSGDMPVINSDKSKIKIISQNGGEPIYIINGIAVDENFDLNTIRPSDISSMVVLKGETATDKYGKKAKNGAIQIFTKSYVGNEEPISKDPKFYSISGTISNSDLENIAQKIENDLNIEVEFSDIVRNEENVITKISVKAIKDNRTSSTTLLNTEGLQSIMIGLSKEDEIVISSKASKGQF